MNRDPEEIYAWGWDELHRIEAEMAAAAERIAPGAGLEGAMQVLREDPTRSIEGIDRLLAHLQELTDRTIADLDGTHFDIPEPLHRMECREAPPGTAAAMYYTAPSADFSRPGRTWYPAKGQTRFPLWTEVTTAYHEGVPGHHLQIGLCMTFQERLTTFQRQLGMYAGHAEGWALYAERLMQELGYLENPDYLLGMLASQAFRAMRVIVDIGLHLQLAIPETEAYHPGRVWDWETALPFVSRYCGFAGPGLCTQRARSLLRDARPGDQLQGRRTSLARYPRSAPGQAGAGVRPEAIPHGCAQPRVAPARSARAGVARSQLTRASPRAGGSVSEAVWGRACTPSPVVSPSRARVARARRTIARRPCRS